MNKKILITMAIAILFFSSGLLSSNAYPLQSNFKQHNSNNSSYNFCGDFNTDGLINVGDAVCIINYIFKGGPAPNPVCIGDANADGSVNVADALWIINYVFKGGMPPNENCCPTAELTHMSECKQFDRDTTPPNQDCLQWYFDGVNLYLRHINAGFNCCPDMAFAFAVEDNMITIQEIQLAGYCDCECLYDLNFTIYNLQPSEYTLLVDEPYYREGYDLLQFTVDLALEPTGMFCVFRDYYPWGI